MNSTFTQKSITCLLAGALGDALGRPVERLRSDKMLEYYGKEGIRDLATVGLKARITDDTQMTIFTADGLIKSFLKHGVDEQGENRLPDMKIVYDSYQDWYLTQTKPFSQCTPKGRISRIEDLYTPVGPGRTCLESLKNGVPGSIEQPINSSAGSGGVMRVAPAGIMYSSDPKTAFEVGAQCAALTHGGPEGYLPAGFLAAVVANLMHDQSLQEALNHSIEILKTYKEHEITLGLIEEAMKLAKTNMDPKIAIEKLGYGFKGDEALAISVYCALKSPNNLKEALIMAVNHSGDSDSTGAITGNILGAHIGLSGIPNCWIKSLELRKEITELAKDLANPQKIRNANSKYPH